MYRAWRLASREKAQFLIGCAILFVFYFGYHAGATFVARAGVLPPYADTAVAYLSWMLVLNGMMYTSSEIERDITQGTFFRIVSLCNGKITGIILVRTAIGFAHSLVLYAMFSALFWVAGLAPQFVVPDVPTLMVLVHAILVGAALGIATSGLAQIVRPVQLYLVPVHLVLLTSSLLQFSGSPASLLRCVLPLGTCVSGTAAQTFQQALSSAAISGAHAVAYLVIGYAFLLWCTRYSRRYGSALQT